ncbi:MAG: phosphotransferase [Dehalococcoidia bacterium]
MLQEAGYELPDGLDLRQHMILTRNETSVPMSPLWPEPLPQRGFQMLLLDQDKRPSRYARCADARVAPFARECRIVERLSRSTAAHALTPRVKTAATHRLRVQVFEYLTDTRNLLDSGALTTNNWLATARSAFATRDALCELSTSLVPWLLEGPEMVSLFRRAEPALKYLRAASALDIDLSPIERVLRQTPPVPQRLQHGDFWPGNLIFCEGSWRVIDFEDFGKVNVPFYDEFHFIQASARMGIAGAGPSGWFDASPHRAPATWMRLWRAFLNERGRRLSLDQDVIGALLVFYVVQMCAHRMRPGAGPSISTDLRSDLRALTKALSSTDRPSGLLPAS